MPILPLDHPEPLAATLGVMLYPGDDEASQKRARAFTTQFLAKPLQIFHDAGHRLPYPELARIASDAGVPLGDIEDRWWEGSATGETFKLFWLLARTEPPRASWANATKLAEAAAGRHKVPGARSALYEARRRYGSVAHLWAAWTIRGRQFQQDLSVGYGAWHDLQFFLAEAEYLRQWGRAWRPPRPNSKPPLPPNTWRVPDGWEPPEHQPNWPQSGGMPDLILPDDLLRDLRRPGRPHKSAYIPVQSSLDT